MPEIIQEIFPGMGGLDWDSDYRFMDGNDSEYRLNITPVASGNQYVISNMKGTTKYSHAFSHGGSYSAAVYTCIGDVYDDNRDAVYFFIYSDLGNDCILRFNFSDQSFDKIAWDHTGIDLDVDYPITDAYLIGDWLHFNPRTSSPRAINVQWAYYDHISYGVNAGSNHAIGDYVAWYNKVYQATAVVGRGLVPPSNPESFSFIGYCYQDVFPQNASEYASPATAGEYARIRDFYNIPTLIPHSPSTVVASDESYEYNNIRGRRFQFCYRHYIPDQGHTITSSFTDVIYPPSSETHKGEVIGDISDYNKITISFPVAATSLEDSNWYDFDTLFEYVEILFREGPDDDWKVAERIDHNVIALSFSGSSYSVDFFNDRAYEVVDNVEIEKQYNPLPKLANAQWTLDGERTAYGGITEGYDNVVDIDVTLDPQTAEITLDSEPTTKEATEYGWSVSYNTSTGKRDWISDSDITLGTAASGDTLKMKVGGYEYYYVLTATTVNEIANGIIAMLSDAGINAQNVSGPKVSFSIDIPYTGYVDDVEVWTGEASSALAKKFRGFKSGAWHPFCQFYYDDALRRAEPVFDSDMRVYVPTLPESLGPYVSNNYRNYIDWTVAHKPPQWARYWRWGYAGNQTIDKFWQYNIASLTSETKPVGADTWTKIDISPLQRIDDDTYASGNHYFPNTSIDAYSWEHGDRLRFITQNTDGATDYSTLDLMNENYDYEIKEFDDTNHCIYIDDLVTPATSTTTTTSPPGVDETTFIIEIYRPKTQTGSTVYYEFGPLYKVYDDGTGTYYHRGETQDQTSGQDATGAFTNGDVYVITRLFSLSPFSTVDNPVFVESYSWSDFSVTEGWGKGKAGFFTGIGEKYLNNVRYSNKYSPNTNTSGLSTFDFLDYKEMSTDHGNITAMRQAGNVLKVYFERNSASVLVNKQQIYNADGTSQLVKSDNVLGDAVYSNYHYGTIFPESVLLKDRTVYFYDIYRDAFLRDSSNGIEPISHYKMRRYFREKSYALRTSGVSNIQVYTAYDYEYDLVYVHFVDSADSSNDEVILFHEPQNRWVAFHQINSTVPSVPTTTTTSTSTSSSTTSTSTHSYDTGLIFGKGSMKLISYIGEDVYLHNSNTTRGNFWGSQYDAIVEVIANESPNIKKTLEAIALHSNKPWNCNYVAIDTDDTYESGMMSKIPEARFVLREGIYCSDYLRNMKTYSSSASTLDLVRGESLRGYYARHRLINDDTTEVTLFKVDVMGNVSRI